MANISCAEGVLNIECDEVFIEPLVRFFNEEKEIPEFLDNIEVVKKGFFVDKTTGIASGSFDFLGFGRWTFDNSLDGLAEDLGEYTEKHPTFKERLNSGKYKTPVISFTYTDYEPGCGLFYDALYVISFEVDDWLAEMVESSDIEYTAANLRELGFEIEALDSGNVDEALATWGCNGTMAPELTVLYNECYGTPIWNDLKEKVEEVVGDDLFYLTDQFLEGEMEDGTLVADWFFKLINDKHAEYLESKGD